MPRVTRRDRRIPGGSGGRPSRLTIGFAAALTLAGCMQAGKLQTSSVTRIAPPENALVLPPPGGPAVVGVIERTFSNAVQQDIALSTGSRVAGQNQIRVQFYGPVDGMEAGDTKLANPPLSLSDFAAEFREQMPGVPMKVSPFFVQNRYGPFGYAVGQASVGDLCLYAWQRIRAPDTSSTLFSRQGTIQLRLRLCEAGAREEDLLAVMYELSINAFFRSGSWNPYGDPLPVPETLGRPGTPVYPGGEAGFTPVLPAAQRSAAPVEAAPRAATAPRRVEPVAEEVVPRRTIPSPDDAPGTRVPAQGPVDPARYAPVPSPDAAGAVAAPAVDANAMRRRPSASAPGAATSGRTADGEAAPAPPPAGRAAADEPTSGRATTGRATTGGAAGGRPAAGAPTAGQGPAAAPASGAAAPAAAFPQVPPPAAVMTAPAGGPACPGGAAPVAGVCPPPPPQ